MYPVYQFTITNYSFCHISIVVQNWLHRTDDICFLSVTYKSISEYFNFEDVGNFLAIVLTLCSRKLCGFTGKSEPIREVAAWPLTSPGDLFSRYGLARNSKQLHLLWNVQILIAVLHSWGQTVKQQQLISNNKINIYLSTIANNNTTAYNYLFMAYFSAFRLFTIGGFFFSVFLIFFDF